MRYVLPLMLILSACVTQSQYTKQLYDQWNGKHVDEAIMVYGKPLNVVDLEKGRKMYEWKSTGSTTAQANTFGTMTTVSANTKYCNIRLSTEPTGIIKAVNWDGYCHH